MRPRFQADADLNEKIAKATLRLEAAVDFRTATEADLKVLPDPEVLLRAAESGRILVSNDKKTLPGEFETFIATRSSPGVLILSQGLPIARAAEELLLI